MRKALLVLVSLVIVATCGFAATVQQNTLPFEIEVDSGSDSLIVMKSSLGLPLSPGLQPGDRVYFSDMELHTRLAFIQGAGNPPAGTTILLPIRHSDGIQPVSVQFVPVPHTPSALAPHLLVQALNLLIAALGLLLLWRGSGKAAAGITTWCFASVAATLLNDMPLPLPYTTVAGWVGTIVTVVGSLVGLFLVAESLTDDSTPSLPTNRLRRSFYGLLAAYLVVVLGYNGRSFLSGHVMPFGLDAVVGLHLSAYLIPLGMLVVGYSRVLAINRARIRWILFSLFVLMFGYVLGVVAGPLGLSFLVGSIAITALTAAAFCGFVYATLRHQLVSLQFVLNRALAYGLVTSLVVGSFAAVLALLERSAINSDTGRFLTLLIPLLLGMGLHTLKRGVDTYIDKLFFRHRRRAQNELAQFGRTCVFIEDETALLDMAADGFFRGTGAQSLVIYIADPSGMCLARRRGVAQFPAILDANDPVLLKMRAGDAEVPVDGAHRSPVTEGNAYGLTVRNRLLGVVICGPRPGEDYTAEERKLFISVAHDVAIGLHGLRLLEQERLLEDLASGACTRVSEARIRARALLRRR